MATDDKRRARKGNTHDPYECCGKEAGSYGRPKGSICADCRKLIEDGQQFRALARESNEAVFQWTSTDYGWPCYYDAGYDFSHKAGLHDKLKRAMFTMVNAVSRPAPQDTPPNAPTWTMGPNYRGGQERRYDAWPTVFRAKGNSHDAWTWKLMVLMRPDVREALDALDQTFRQALADVYQEGKRVGGSLLHGLITGELSQADFDEGLLSSADQAQQRKSRRGY